MPYPTSPQSTVDDDASQQIQQLRELGELKNQGLLTDDEFAQQKHRILGQ